jgi:Rrf2 family iron-sulfur cluster assembly transcriptional regulator
MTHDLWMSLNARIYDYLDSVHLAELVQQQLDKPADAAGHKHEHRRVLGSAELKVAANG